MRTLLLLASVVPALVASAAPAPAGETVVSITKSGFEPAKVTIRAGDSVTWTNKDVVPHQVVSDNGAFGPSPALLQGQSWSNTFTSAGRFNYHDGLKPTAKGTVVVTPPPPTVSIVAARKSIVYGGRTTVSGKISTGAARETVQILARPCGNVGVVKVASLKTTAGGAFALRVKPVRQRVYGAQWKKAASPALAIRVRPLMRLRRLARNRFGLRVSAAQSFAGRSFLLQRFDVSNAVWVPARSGVLSAGGSGAPPTVFSAGTLRASIAAGAKVRAVLGAAQTGPCYAPGTSNVVRN